MNSSNLRASAREKLAGKWKKAAIATLAYVFVTGLITNINHFFEEGSALYQLFSIIGTIVEVPLSFGFLSTMFKLHDDEEISYTGFFNDGFSKVIPIPPSNRPSNPFKSIKDKCNLAEVSISKIIQPNEWYLKL